MKRWALLVVVLYATLLLATLLPAMLLAFYPAAPGELSPVLRAWPFWAGLLVLMACQWGLLFVPIKAASRRPVSRRALVWPFLASGFFLLLLVLGAFSCIHETWEAGRQANPATERAWGAVGWTLLAGTWLVWALVFRRLSRAPEQDLVARVCRLLLKGSILELLVAVPTHVLARSRDYCCAGFGTFAGIACGLAVMLASFGPGVFWLYAARWKRLHPEPPTAEPARHDG